MDYGVFGYLFKECVLDVVEFLWVFVDVVVGGIVVDFEVICVFVGVVSDGLVMLIDWEWDVLEFMV